MNTQKAIEKLQNCYPSGVELTYIAYDDCFEDMGELNKILQGDDDSFWENSDWIYESQWEGIKDIMRENFADDELDDEAKESCKDWLESKNTSDAFTDLLKNTREQFFFYDLGVEIEPSEYHAFMCDGFTSEQEQRRERSKIYKALKLKQTPENKKLVNELYNNASYGGSLVILFTAKPLDTYNIGEENNEISFTDPYICIMDRVQGSGYDMQFSGFYSFAFDKKRLNLDAGVGGYSYSGEVCGLCKDGYDTNWRTYKKKKKKANDKPIEPTKIEQYAEKVKQWDKKLKEEKLCSRDDPRYKSHDTEYSNDLPCGDKCKTCGRFFID